MNILLSILVHFAMAGDADMGSVRAFNIPINSVKNTSGFDEQGQIGWSARCRTLFGEGYSYSIHLKDTRKSTEQLTIVCMKRANGVALFEGVYEIPDGEYYPSDSLAKKKPVREAASTESNGHEEPLELGM